MQASFQKPEGAGSRGFLRGRSKEARRVMNHDASYGQSVFFACRGNAKRTWQACFEVQTH